MPQALWQPPTLRQDGLEDSDRRATWLELFYDLVFVATISQLSHYLSGHLTWAGVLGSALSLLLLATLGSQLSSLSIVVWAAIACGAQVVFDLAKTRPAAQPKAE